MWKRKNSTNNKQRVSFRKLFFLCLFIFYNFFFITIPKHTHDHRNDCKRLRDRTRNRTRHQIVREPERRTNHRKQPHLVRALYRKRERLHHRTKHRQKTQPILIGNQGHRDGQHTKTDCHVVELIRMFLPNKIIQCVSSER